MTQCTVQIKLATDRSLKECPPPELGEAMGEELAGFQSWFIDQGNAPLVGMEQAILKTYLAWKLLHEAGCPASQD